MSGSLDPHNDENSEANDGNPAWIIDSLRDHIRQFILRETLRQSLVLRADYSSVSRFKWFLESLGKHSVLAHLDDSQTLQPPRTEYCEKEDETQRWPGHRSSYDQNHCNQHEKAEFSNVAAKYAMSPRQLNTCRCRYECCDNAERCSNRREPNWQVIGVYDAHDAKEFENIDDSLPHSITFLVSTDKSTLGLGRKTTKSCIRQLAGLPHRPTIHVNHLPCYVTCFVAE